MQSTEASLSSRTECSSSMKRASYPAETANWTIAGEVTSRIPRSLQSLPDDLQLSRLFGQTSAMSVKQRAGRSATSQGLTSLDRLLLLAHREIRVELFNSHFDKTASTSSLKLGLQALETSLPLFTQPNCRGILINVSNLSTTLPTSRSELLADASIPCFVSYLLSS